MLKCILAFRFQNEWLWDVPQLQSLLGSEHHRHSHGTGHHCRILVHSVWSRWVHVQKPSRGHQLLLLPWALKPTVGFGLLNNIIPLFPIYHQLSPSIHSQHLKDLFLLLLSILSWVFPFVLSPPVLEWRSFWASYPPQFPPGELIILSFAILSILLYFLPCSSLPVFDSSYFSILRFHI